METVRWVLGPCGATQVERHAVEVTVHRVEVRAQKKHRNAHLFLSPLKK
jgi:hypothetical protein